MKGYSENIEKTARENRHFRRVLYTAKNSQLVVMRLAPLEDIGEEVHTLDQFIRCESGKVTASIDGNETHLTAGCAVIIPAGAHHNISNVSPDTEAKLSTLYAPPNHKNGTIHHTKADAVADTEHFDGILSE